MRWTETVGPSSPMTADSADHRASDSKALVPAARLAYSCAVSVPRAPLSSSAVQTTLPIRAGSTPGGIIAPPMAPSIANIDVAPATPSASVITATADTPGRERNSRKDSSMAPDPRRCTPSASALGKPEGSSQGHLFPLSSGVVHPRMVLPQPARAAATLEQTPLEQAPLERAP